MNTNAKTDLTNTSHATIDLIASFPRASWKDLHDALNDQLKALRRLQNPDHEENTPFSWAQPGPDLAPQPFTCGPASGPDLGPPGPDPGPAHSDPPLALQTTHLFVCRAQPHSTARAPSVPKTIKKGDRRERTKRF